MICCENKEDEIGFEGAGNHWGGDAWIVKLDESGNIEWQKCFGGSINDHVSSVRQTLDGGYIAAGSTDSHDGDVSGNHGEDDAWVIRLDAYANIEWQHCYGGSREEYATSIRLTTDGGFIMLGWSGTGDGEVLEPIGNGDFCIVKLDGSGYIEWQNIYGMIEHDQPFSIQQTTDGGYVAADAYVHACGGHEDVAYYGILKIDPNGTLEWEKSYGGCHWDMAFSVQQTSDQGYIVTGWTWSDDGDVKGNNGYVDCWVIKLDLNGSLQWEKCYWGLGWDEGHSIHQTTDGGFIIAGSTAGSNEGDVSGNHGDFDAWILKLDASGNIQWQKCLGGTERDLACEIQQTKEGGYIVAFNSSPQDGGAAGTHGETDIWIVKLDESGTIQWQKCLGGSGNDYVRSLQQTSDGGYILAGGTDSIDGDVALD